MESGPVWHIPAAAAAAGRLEITPASVGWRFTASTVVSLAAGQVVEDDTGGNEVALVPLEGRARFEFDGGSHVVSRRDVFTELPHVAYLPPRTAYRITALDPFEYSTGAAPAEGRFPARMIGPDELPTSVRGDANVRRGVTGTLDLTLPAERLLAYEIITPSGNWSSFPPHLHDGTHGSSYQEETYYFRMEPRSGFAIQRIYTSDGSLDLSIASRHGDLNMVHRGFHTVVAAPGTNVYYLNFMAGDVRQVTQFIDPDLAWVSEDWAGRPLDIPVPRAAS